MAIITRRRGFQSCITLETLREYIAGPASEGRKLSTIAHRIRMLRSFLSWLVEEGHIGKSPAARLREPKLPARIPKPLPFEDLELLRDACRTAREHALIDPTTLPLPKCSGLTQSE